MDFSGAPDNAEAYVTIVEQDESTQQAVQRTLTASDPAVLLDIPQGTIRLRVESAQARAAVVDYVTVGAKDKDVQIPLEWATP